MADWTETHRPTTLAAVRGNNKARDQFEEWADTWDDHRKAVILHGSPGVGKTSAAHALAADKGWTTIELDASDQRTAAVIERVAGEAARSGTLTGGTGGKKLVILDEADNLHGNVDRGGAAALTRLVKEASQPMVLIANEFYDMSQGLRKACETIEFRDVSARSIVPVLRDVCRKEGVEFDEPALEAIAEQTSGDLRSAINDLQAIAERTDRLTVEDVVTGERDRTKGIFPFLDDVFKNEDAQGALYAAYDVDETPDNLLSWVEDNVPKDYAGPELADAYGHLAAADRWLGRVRATQNYSYWRYATDNVAAGVAASRRESKGGWTRYGPPSYWSKLGRSRGTRNRRDYVARRIAERGGVSMSSARREILPYLASMTHHCQNRELTVAMTARYDLDAEHVSLITGSGANTKKVQEIVEDAERLREERAVEHSGGAFEPATDPDANDSAATGARPDEGSAGSDDAGDEPTLPIDEPTEHDGESAADDSTSAADNGESAEDDDMVASDDETENDEDQSGLADFL